MNEKNLNIVCAFDDNFPMIDNNIKNSEKPFLFVYKGNNWLKYFIDLDDTFVNSTILNNIVLNAFLPKILLYFTL